MDHGQVGTGNHQAPGAASGAQHELVVGQAVCRAVRTADVQPLVFPVDPFGAGLGEHLDILAVFEKGLVPHHVKAGFAQVVDVADISGNIEGDAAAAVGDETVPVDDGDFGLGLQPFEPAGGLAAEGHAADDEYILSHELPSPYRKMFSAFDDNNH